MEVILEVVAIITVHMVEVATTVAAMVAAAAGVGPTGDGLGGVLKTVQYPAARILNPVM